MANSYSVPVWVLPMTFLTSSGNCARAVAVGSGFHQAGLWMARGFSGPQLARRSCLSGKQCQVGFSLHIAAQVCIVCNRFGGSSVETVLWKQHGQGTALCSAMYNSVRRWQIHRKLQLDLMWTFVKSHCQFQFKYRGARRPKWMSRKTSLSRGFSWAIRGKIWQNGQSRKEQMVGNI